MELYCIKNIANSVTKNYLSNRSQSVRINNDISEPRPIHIGLPQGSILGPLLFLFFINDLPNISDNFSSILFADDTTLSFSSQSVHSLELICNNELEKVYNWTVANRLSINLGKNKTFFILHTYRSINESDISVKINNIPIEICNEGPFLGINIDSKLKFVGHINNTCNKIAKSIGIIYKMKNLVPKSVLKQMYYSLIYPYINYCICIYGGTYNTHMNRIFLLQKRIVRIINNAPFLAHTDALFYESIILKVSDIYKLNMGMYMFEHLTPGMFARNHPYDTRHRSDLLPNRSHLTICQNSISIIGPQIWNSIPDDIKYSTSKSSFKRNYKKLLLSSYIS